MKQALVDIEDSRFYEHNGVDVQGTLRALVKNVAAGSVQEGGSTLTQQLVKQTLLQTATTPGGAGGRGQGADVGRKLKEARLALALEKTYSKDEILTRYLNIVYFGEGAYGIQAAAQKYFSVTPPTSRCPRRRCWPAWCRAPPGDDPIAHPQNADEPAQPGAAADAHAQAHLRPGARPTISAQPVAVVQGASPPNGCIDAALGGLLLRLPLRATSPARSASARTSIKNGGLDDPDDAAPRSAAARPTRPC